MTTTKIKSPSNIDKINLEFQSNIDKVNLFYLLRIPEKSRNLVDIMCIKTLEAKLKGVK